MNYDEVFEKSPEGMLVFDNQGFILRANEHLSSLLAYEEEELISTMLCELFNEADSAKILSKCLNLTVEDELIINTAMRKKTGSLVYTQTKFKRISDEILLAVVRDVAVNIEILKQLQSSEENFRQITEHIRDVFFLRDFKTRQFLYISPGYKKIWQRPLSELYANPDSWLDFVHPEDRKRVQKRYAEKHETGSFDAKYRIIRPDGQIRYIHARVFPVYDEHNNLYRTAGVAEDITEEMQIAEDKLSASDNVEHSIHELMVAIITAFEQRDPYTVGHQNNVAYLSKAIAQELKFDKKRLKGLEIAALVHDIGKIGIPAEILNKPKELTKIEYELIKTHPQAGYDILKGIQFPWPVAEMVLMHHERMDGSGYPHGLKGEQILFEARIIAVADCLDELLAARAYNPPLDPKTALAKIQEKKEKFDQKVLKACTHLLLEKKIAPYLTRLSHFK
ncbi:HD domain-containing phosphohydrolase [Legionella yabuuchiae]|uniref:HD domain-containing phosphohydrolase n=1 Tax=Legionella yabuuchiae TaxID=376727 RepID=UPI0013EF7DC1|nr:HD domain-containing phosphohydrolase [Legionella yabuuchiae]